MRLSVARVYLSLLFVLIVAGSVVGGSRVMAQTAPAVSSSSPAASATPRDGDRIAALEKQNADNAALIAAAQTAGDNGWMLVSAALVLMMSGPGLALFYGGLVRKKNILGTMMQTFILMAVVSVIWALYGYSLAFSQGNSFVGGVGYLFLRGVGGEANPDYAATIPQQT